MILRFLKEHSDISVPKNGLTLPQSCVNKLASLGGQGKLGGGPRLNEAFTAAARRHQGTEI